MSHHARYSRQLDRMPRATTLAIGDTVQAFGTIAWANEGRTLTVDAIADGFAVGHTSDKRQRVSFTRYQATKPQPANR